MGDVIYTFFCFHYTKLTHYAVYKFGKWSCYWNANTNNHKGIIPTRNQHIRGWHPPPPCIQRTALFWPCVLRTELPTQIIIKELFQLGINIYEGDTPLPLAYSVLPYFDPAYCLILTLRTAYRFTKENKEKMIVI